MSMIWHSGPQLAISHLTRRKHGRGRSKPVSTLRTRSIHIACTTYGTHAVVRVCPQMLSCLTHTHTLASCDNCHSHVAYALNEMGYSGYRNWNMIILCFWILFAGKWVSVGAFLKSWLPFCIIVGIVLFFKYGL